MSNSPNGDARRFALVFKALSNPHRLNIFRRLLDCCGNEAHRRSDEEIRACVGVIGKDLGIVASTVSHHIKELHHAGLIRMERNGQNVECWVDADMVRELSELFDGWVAVRNS